MSETTQTASRGGIGFAGSLFILFLGLRLTDHIDWEWYWVAAPLWMPAGVVIAFMSVLAVFAGLCYSAAGIAGLFKRKRKS